jgi:hypothetical protein
MSIERKTILDQISVDRSGVVSLRFAVQVYLEDILLDEKWHRTCVMPGVPVQDQLDEVNRHLTSMSAAAVSQEECDKIVSFADAAQAAVNSQE